ncbi:MAG: multidrug transporter [Verrucomicrobiales bacterium]|nr:multidrug transporter [Verrucomicrobiales bacterium]
MNIFNYHKRLLSLLCITLAVGCSKPADKPADKATEPAANETKPVVIKRDDKGSVVVTVSEEAQKRIDLKVEELKPAQHVPELAAYGTVLDPTTLITAQNEIAATTVALETSRKAATRAKSLFDQGENVARKTLETAEADVRANEIKLQSLQQQIALEWGQSISKLSANDLQTLINDVLASKTALARVELPSGETITGEPTAARVSTVNSEQWQTAKIVSRSTKVDPKTQGEAFLVECNSASLRPGASVTALLQTTKSAQQGVTVPESAVVLFVGKAWTYVATSTNAFTRTEISLQTPVDGGWFQSSTNSVKAGDSIIVQGAQDLLSEEQKAQITID